ncbi:MAG: F0F1 ATP synthase subunit epsilon [Bacteroidales bacterium]|jgi:F-type H+-transporting ATPase subunit epsilon|nr:F0F1 ATP synthase subunit epsilon [Bacteroidales bacterium]NPV35822.1 F0F1 ATP synthase subunit epsilon [Bacteroidales bacterium]
MHLEIISPEKSEGSFENVKSVVFPGKDGSFGVLENHAPMVALLSHGTIKITMNDNSVHTIEVSSGIAEIKNNRITVIVK